ncbi:MAG TPA: hypoxanthine phosphoribosyltransferase [Thermoanaerobaculia bacterium]
MAYTTLISRSQIQQRVSQLAHQIASDFEGTDLIALVVLKGSMFFAVDLLREMNVDLAVDVIQVSSYGKEKYSSGVVTILKEPQLDMHGKGVLIIEDIIDSGFTIREVHRYIEGRGARPVKVVSLLDKPAARKVPFVPDYIGFTIEPKFVVGYGLDDAELYRNVPEVRVVTE